MTSRKLIAVLGLITAPLGADMAIVGIDPIPTQDVQFRQELGHLEQKGNVIEAQMSWRGEKGLKIKYDLGEPTLGERMADKRKKEVLIKQADFNDGGFKIDLILNEKPDINIFCYTIEGYENYDFFYQPPLTQEEIDKDAQRPEEIVGSYAIYHKRLKNHKIGGENYAIGKVAHIPFPYVWEINNVSTKQRAEDLTYEDGQLCVIVQQNFLDSANYPVRIDPTFGITSNGSSGFGSGLYIYKAMYNSPASSGTLTKISWYGQGYSASADAKGGLYDSSNNLIVGSGAITMADAPLNTRTLYEVSVSGSIIGGQNYYITTMMQAVGIIGYDAGGSAGAVDTDAYGTFTDPISWTGTGKAYIFSVYATYTETGGNTINASPVNNSGFWE